MSDPQAAPQIIPGKPFRGTVPEGEIVYAIGDIHGEADLFGALLRTITEDAQTRPEPRKHLVLLGDYIDRGPHSRQVIEAAMQLDQQMFEVVCLLGNHESIMLEFLDNPAVGPAWARHGGLETLRSYGVTVQLNSADRNWREISTAFGNQLPDTHRQFLKGLAHSHVVGDFLFCHAGVNPALPLESQPLSDLLWIREAFLNDDSPLAKVIVHGHTPAIAVFSDNRRIGIDTGAYATGTLSSVRLTGQERTFIQSRRGTTAPTATAVEAPAQAEPQAEQPGLTDDGPNSLYIATHLIEPNPDQPRRFFNESDLADLAASIQEKGLLLPILVRPLPGFSDRFQIISGERRWRAAKTAGLAKVPVIVRALNDLEVLEVSIIENVQRADLTPLEEAHGYRALIERFNRTQESVAQTVGKSRSYVANILRLLQLPDPVREHLEAGRLTAGHARALISASDPIALAERIVAEGLTVRDAESLARRPTKPTAINGGFEPSAPPRTTQLAEHLTAILGQRVFVHADQGIGEMRIRFASPEQMEALGRRLELGGALPKPIEPAERAG